MSQLEYGIGGPGPHLSFEISYLHDGIGSTDLLDFSGGGKPKGSIFKIGAQVTLAFKPTLVNDLGSCD